MILQALASRAEWLSSLSTCGAAALLLVACAQVPRPRSVREAREDLFATDAELGRGVYDPASLSLAAFVHEDAVIVLRSGPARGLAAIRAALAADSELATATMSWRPVIAQVSRDGLDGFTYGYADVHAPDGAVHPGKYLAYWRRDGAGRWRILAWKRLRRPPGTPADPPAFVRAGGAGDGPVFPGGRSVAIDALRATDVAFAALAAQGVSAAFRRFTAPDGATLGSGASIAFGATAVAAEFSGLAPGSLAWHPTFIDAAESGDLGFGIGPVQLRETAANGQVTERPAGFYLTIWKRMPGGEWKVIIDG